MGIVIRQSIKGTFVNYIGVALGIVMQFVVVTRFVEPDVLGLTQLIYNVGILFSTLCLLGVTASGMRYYPYFHDSAKKDNGFLFYYLLLPVVGCIVFGIVYLLLREPIIGYFGEKSPAFTDYFYWVLPLMMILTFWSVGETYANIFMRIAIPKAVREIGMRLFLLAAYLSYAFGLVGVSGMIAMMYGGYAVCMLTTGGYALHIGGGTLKHDWNCLTRAMWRKIVLFSGFIISSSVAGQILAFIDAMMLSSLQGLYSMGVYTIANYMSNIVNMPSRSISSIASPIAAQALKDGDMPAAQKQYRLVSLHQFLASALLLALVWVTLDDIFAIIPNGDIYAEGRWAVLFLGLMQIVNCTFGFGGTLIGYSKYYWVTLVFSVLLTFLGIYTNLYCIPRWGITGAAVATLTSATVSCILQQIVVQWLLHTNPLTWAHLRGLIVVVILLCVDLVLPSLIDVSPWLDVFVRGGVFVVLATCLVYVMRISEQVNRLVDSYVLRRKS